MKVKCITDGFIIRHMPGVYFHFLIQSINISGILCQQADYSYSFRRIQSWVIGIMLGFLLYEKRSEKVNISSLLDAMLWVLSLSTLSVIVLMGHIFATPYVSYTSTLVANAIFMSTHRIAWSLALAYIIFACENLKSGSIVRWFLSHSYWKPIGTMGLSLYITHVIYMMLTMMNQRQSFIFSAWPMVRNFER